MESALQLFYLVMAGYGWYEWRYGGSGHSELQVSTWPPRYHVIAIAGVGLLMLLSGAVLSRYTAASLPFADSFTTWGAVVATFMVARKILENWLYWFVIDAVSIGLYVDRELYFAAALFGLYLVMIVFGYRAWRRSMREAAA
jgi:nicotinamide mononucleotide transporter